MVDPNRPQMVIQRMRFLCLITKATDIHSWYEVLIAFQFQEWLHACASVLHYMYNAFLFEV